MALKYKVITTTSLRSDPNVSPSSSEAVIGKEVKDSIIYLASTTKYGSGKYYKLSKPYVGRIAYVSISDIEKYVEKDALSEDDKSIISAHVATGKLANNAIIYSTDSYYTSSSTDASTGYMLKKGDEIHITDQSTNGFYKITSVNSVHKAGWVSMAIVTEYNSSGKVIQKVDSSSAEYKVAAQDAAAFKKNAESYKEVVLSASSYETLTGTAKLQSKTTQVEKLLVKNLNGIHGVPYQFMDTVDRRIGTGASLGRKYTERIVAKMPLLLLTPGAPDFLPTYSKQESGIILDSLLGGANKLSGDSLNKVLKTSGRYYTFKFCYDEYYKYVNSLLRMCAVYLGIADEYHGNGFGKGYSEKLGSFKWQKAVNHELRGFINAQEFIAFYLDSDTSISESISTSTTTSDLMDTMNGFSKTAKELQFLAGPIAGLKAEALQADDFDATMKDIQGISNKYLNNNRLFNNLAEQFATVGKGGKIAFPEIWDDTEFSKSYDISIKLRTPDADKLSWYLNICVPLIHLLCLAAPRQLGPNGYRAPFLVRGYYKGLFNCDMGIITNMSITKGRDSAWSADGLPTEVDVSVSLKDLYSLLTITNASSTVNGVDTFKKFLNNTCLMDYLANTCGVNINKPEIERTLETYVLLTKNKMKDSYSDQWMSFQNGLSNLGSKAYNKFSMKTN